MSSKPHSQTVRGTFDNPKTQEAMKSDEPIPQLGDHISLKAENSDKPLPSNAPGSESSSPSQSRDATTKDLPHSKTVRGTLANKDGKEVNKTALGDPVSLKAETSQTDMGNGVEREGKDKTIKSKL